VQNVEALDGRLIDQARQAGRGRWTSVEQVDRAAASDLLGGHHCPGERIERMTTGPHRAPPPTNVAPRSNYCDARCQRRPVLVRRGAKVQAFTRLVGPCVIGEDTLVSGGRIASSSIGEHCKVHGEISMSVFTSHSNKGHDGFIGHSVLGRWVNLGAGTVNSNLKNNYSGVSFWTPRGMELTGQRSWRFHCDHAKPRSARLTAGAVIVSGTNVYEWNHLRYIPRFRGDRTMRGWELDVFWDHGR
jgi:hypothetical protein